MYAVGLDRVHRLRWEAGRLALDRDWSPRYRDRPGQGHGWDPVIAGGRVWFLDQGRHRFRSTMRGAGLDPEPVRLHALAVEDPGDHRSAVVCGRRFGAVTNPPLVDPVRGIALGYDSAAGVIAAFDTGELAPLWSRRLNTAGHLLRFPGSGEAMAYDQRLRPPFGIRPAAAALEMAGTALSGLARRTATASLLGAATGEDVVVLDLETGAERGRARVPAPMQSVCFPAPGWRRDVYYCSLSTVARVAVGRPARR